MIEILRNWKRLPADMQVLLAIFLLAVAALPFVIAGEILVYVEYRRVMAYAQQSIVRAEIAEREADKALQRITEVME